jgi:hypothetical protein
MKAVGKVAKKHGLSPSDLWGEVMFQPEGMGQDIEADEEEREPAAAPAPADGFVRGIVADLKQTHGAKAAEAAKAELERHQQIASGKEPGNKAHAAKMVEAITQAIPHLEASAKPATKKGPAKGTDKPPKSKPPRAKKPAAEPLKVEPKPPAALPPDLHDTINSHVVDWHGEKGAGMPFHELYNRLKVQHPDLTPAQFRDAINKMRDTEDSTRVLRVSAFPQADKYLPNPELAIKHSDNTMYYASPVGKSLEKSTAKLAERYGIQGQTPAKPPTAKQPTHQPLTKPLHEHVADEFAAATAKGKEIKRGDPVKDGDRLHGYYQDREGGIHKISGVVAGASAADGQATVQLDSPVGGKSSVTMTLDAAGKVNDSRFYEPHPDHVKTNLALGLPVPDELRGKAPIRSARTKKPAAAVHFAAVHAPAGGVTIAGTEYTGGQFIPGDVVEKATAEEKAQLAGKKDGEAGVSAEPPHHEKVVQALQASVDAIVGDAEGKARQLVDQAFAGKVTNAQLKKAAAKLSKDAEVAWKQAVSQQHESVKAHAQEQHGEHAKRGDHKELKANMAEVHDTLADSIGAFGETLAGMEEEYEFGDPAKWTDEERAEAEQDKARYHAELDKDRANIAEYADVAVANAGFYAKNYHDDVAAQHDEADEQAKAERQAKQDDLDFATQMAAESNDFDDDADGRELAATETVLANKALAREKSEWRLALDPETGKYVHVPAKTWDVKTEKGQDRAAHCPGPRHGRGSRRGSKAPGRRDRRCRDRRRGQRRPRKRRDGQRPGGQSQARRQAERRAGQRRQPLSRELRRRGWSLPSRPGNRVRPAARAGSRGGPRGRRSPARAGRGGPGAARGGRAAGRRPPHGRRELG